MERHSNYYYKDSEDFDQGKLDRPGKKKLRKKKGPKEKRALAKKGDTHHRGEYIEVMKPLELEQLEMEPLELEPLELEPESPPNSMANEHLGYQNKVSESSIDIGGHSKVSAIVYIKEIYAKVHHG